MQLEITSRAQEELRESGVGQENYLRLMVRPGGCAGMTYSMTLDDHLKEGDAIIYHAGDLRVISDSASTPYLDGLHIDYSDDLIDAGFSITNPNAAHTCGCGSSFGC